MASTVMMSLPAARTTSGTPVRASRFRSRWTAWTAAGSPELSRASLARGQSPETAAPVAPQHEEFGDLVARGAGVEKAALGDQHKARKYAVHPYQERVAASLVPVVLEPGVAVAAVLPNRRAPELGEI